MRRRFKDEEGRGRMETTGMKVRRKRRRRRVNEDDKDLEDVECRGELVVLCDDS